MRRARSSRSRFDVTFAGGVLILGCASAACTPKSPRGGAFLDQLAQRPDSFVAEVARARNLPVTGAVRIALDDDAAFAAATAAMGPRSEAVPSTGTSKAFYVAFHFASDPLPLGQGQGTRGKVPPRPSTEDEVLEEQLLGFYDDGTRVIHVRKSRLTHGSSKDELEQRFVVGHEIEHALVHQRFGDQLPRSEPDDDQRTAKMALLEGDASLAAVLALAERAHKLPRRMLARASDYVHDGSFDKMAADNAENRALRAAPANEREKLLFPYSAGLTLMNELYRAGGLPLVDAAFSRPPLSTEHVLHPEKYLAGELPVVVRAPAIPAGFDTVLAGRMGELMTGVVLARCMAPEVARAAASGWGGDAYSIGVSAQGSVMVSWSTTWDDEPSAVRFADAVNEKSACLGSGNRKGPWTLGPGVTVVREGTRVGLVLGLAPDVAAPLAVALPALVAPVVAATPPFGARQLVPTRAPSEAAHGRLVPGAWQSDLLGVNVPVWPAFEVTTKPESDSFLMKADHPSFVLMSLELLDEPVSPATYQRVFGEMEGILTRAGKVRFQRSWEGATRTPLGEGAARQWTVPGTTFAATVSVVPICRGTGAYVLMTAWADTVSYNAAHQWVSQLRALPGEPPVCADLDP